MHLHHIVDVDTRQLERDQDLDHEFVPGRGGEVGRGAQPLGQLRLTLLGDVEALLRAVVGRVVGFDEPVPLEALQGRVHLPDVERPHLAGPGLELLSQLKAVLRALTQQRQQGVPNTHQVLRLLSILSILLDSSTSVQSHTAWPVWVESRIG